MARNLTAPASEPDTYDLSRAERRLREEQESGCASPLDITFWQSEVLRLGGSLARPDRLRAGGTSPTCSRTNDNSTPDDPGYDLGPG